MREMTMHWTSSGSTLGVSPTLPEAFLPLPPSSNSITSLMDGASSISGAVMNSAISSAFGGHGDASMTATHMMRRSSVRRWTGILGDVVAKSSTYSTNIRNIAGEHGDLEVKNDVYGMNKQCSDDLIAMGSCGWTSAKDESSRMRSLVPAVAYQAKEEQTLGDALRMAGRKALGGGIPGAAAMAIQVLSLMWMRTTINYQYRYGMTTTQALKHLYKEGGVVRFYRGLGPALLQGPLSRFGDTAANAGMLALLESSDKTKDLPVGVKTLAASASAGAFRIFLMPIDALKTIMQVEGKAGFPALMAKVKTGGPTVLYHGALAASAATFVGHYPWFATYNYLNATLPQYDELPKKLLRSAFIGFCSSAVSDTVSNSIRVIKTTRQTATEPMTYPQVVRSVIASDGVLGLMGRGLKTKIISNGIQGLLFSVLWRLGQDFYNRKETN